MLMGKSTLKHKNNKLIGLYYKTDTTIEGLRLGVAILGQVTRRWAGRATTWHS